MFIKLNDIILFDLLWMPFFISIYVFIIFIYLIKDPVIKTLSINQTPSVKNTKFTKNKYYGDYLNLIKFSYKFVIYLYCLFFFNNSYTYMYICYLFILFIFF